MSVLENDVPITVLAAAFGDLGSRTAGAADRNRLLSEETVSVEWHGAQKRRHARVIGHAGSRDAALLDRIRQDAVDDLAAPEPARLRHVAGGPDVRQVGAHQIVDQNAGVDLDARSV